MPIELVKGLTGKADELRNVEIVHILTFCRCALPRSLICRQSFRHNALFIGHNARKAVNDGRADFTPVFLSEIPSLFREGGTLPLDVALVSLSPPDEHGFCSFGVEVGTTKPAAEAAQFIVAEINKQMPRTLGDSFIHLSRLTAVDRDRLPDPGGAAGRQLRAAPEGRPEHRRHDPRRRHLADGHRQHS